MSNNPLRIKPPFRTVVSGGTLDDETQQRILDAAEAHGPDGATIAELEAIIGPIAAERGVKIQVETDSAAPTECARLDETVSPVAAADEVPAPGRPASPVGAGDGRFDVHFPGNGRPWYANHGRHPSPPRHPSDAVSLDNTHDLVSHHPPTPDQAARHSLLAEGAETLLNLILENTPDCSDRQRATEHVRAAKMWASAAVALEPDEADEPPVPPARCGAMSTDASPAACVLPPHDRAIPHRPFLHPHCRLYWFDGEAVQGQPRTGAPVQATAVDDCIVLTDADAADRMRAAMRFRVADAPGATEEEEIAREEFEGVYPGITVDRVGPIGADGEVAVAFSFGDSAGLWSARRGFSFVGAAAKEEWDALWAQRWEMEAARASASGRRARPATHAEILATFPPRHPSAVRAHTIEECIAAAGDAAAAARIRAAMGAPPISDSGDEAPPEAPPVSPATPAPAKLDSSPSVATSDSAVSDADSSASREGSPVSAKEPMTAAQALRTSDFRLTSTFREYHVYTTRSGSVPSLCPGPAQLCPLPELKELFAARGEHLVTKSLDASQLPGEEMAIVTDAAWERLAPIREQLAFVKETIAIAQLSSGAAAAMCAARVVAGLTEMIASANDTDERPRPRRLYP